MTRRQGKYRHIKPLPGPPIQNHEQWVCTGCGRIEWFDRSSAVHVDRRWHCGTLHADGTWEGTACWMPIVNLTYIGLDADALLAAAAVGGPEAVRDMCDAAARAREGDAPHLSIATPGVGVS